MTRDGTVGVSLVSDRARLAQAPYVPEIVIPAVRDAMIQAGMGQKDPEAPLKDIVAPGMTVLLKPNWVLHMNHSGQGMQCMVTHPLVIGAVVEQLRRAGAGRIVIGDAPIQSCMWEQLVTPHLVDTLREIAGPCPLDVVDFRRTRTRAAATMAEGVSTDLRDTGYYVLFDLARDSLLEPISTPHSPFRITSYDPAKMKETHQPGRHQYLICREAFDADVVISLPKLKTHRKAGITAALKNLVGINGNKDFLPHHRFGGSDAGGDCYAGAPPWKLAAEVYLDIANARINTPAYAAWSSRAFALLGLHGRHADADVEGAWHGNDTIWRTVLDLNRILVYGDAQGTMADAPRRTLWSLTDGIVCGQGEGPLSPTPATLGAITFSASAAHADHVHAALLGLDPQRIPVVREAVGRCRWPLTDGSPLSIRAANAPRTLQEIARLGITAIPPRGWRGRCELSPVPANADFAALATPNAPR